MLVKLYPYRFELFFFSQISILFGSLLVPFEVFENLLSPILFQINLLAGILLISKRKYHTRFFATLLGISAVILLFDITDTMSHKIFSLVRMVIYFLFYIVVSYNIIKQVWKAKEINKGVIFGLISGYISLGLIGFFICLSIELAVPNSFQGLMIGDNNASEGLLYYSYITLLTIGYGDILPVTALAHKAAILIGFMGQIYLTIISAVVVGKYINQTKTI